MSGPGAAPGTAARPVSSGGAGLGNRRAPLAVAVEAVVAAAVAVLFVASAGGLGWYRFPLAALAAALVVAAGEGYRQSGSVLYAAALVAMGVVFIWAAVMTVHNPNWLMRFPPIGPPVDPSALVAR